MKRSDIIELYKKGFSVDFIINAYYRDKKKNSNDICSYFDNKILIIKRNGVKKIDCRNYVENCLYDYLFDKNSVEQFFEN